MYILVYTMNITRSLQKWGNGTGVRLPKEVVEAARLKIDQPLEVTMRGRSIVLTPAKQDEDFTLETMLKDVKPLNSHPEIDWGPDVGAEIIDD